MAEEVVECVGSDWCGCWFTGHCAVAAEDFGSVVMFTLKEKVRELKG